MRYGKESGIPFCSFEGVAFRQFPSYCSAIEPRCASRGTEPSKETEEGCTKNVRLMK